MIGRRGKALILAYVAFLTVLFFMCSTDLIIREPETEIYQIAVIIEDVRDDNYVNFRKGMDQAAVEFNGDVHFITLYERMDANQQMELISREQQDGADALIIVPADEERVVSSLAQGQVWAPVVLLGSGLTGQGVAGTIALDYRGMGEKLASRMAEDLEEGCQVVILEEPGRKSVMSRLFLEGAKDMFDKEGILWRSVTPKRTDGGLEEAVLALWGAGGGVGGKSGAFDGDGGNLGRGAQPLGIGTGGGRGGRFARESFPGIDPGALRPGKYPWGIK